MPSASTRKNFINFIVDINSIEDADVQVENKD